MRLSLLQKHENAHEDSVWTAAWAPDGSTLVTGSVDESVKLWNEAGDTLEQKHQLVGGLPSSSKGPEHRSQRQSYFRRPCPSALAKRPLPCACSVQHILARMISSIIRIFCPLCSALASHSALARINRRAAI